MKPSPRRRAWLGAALLAEILFFTFTLRMRMLTLPLDRSEGEFAYVARAMGSGALPYRDTEDRQAPATFLWYRLAFKALGDAPATPRVWAALYCVALLLAFLNASRLWLRPLPALVAAAALSLALCEPWAASAGPTLFLLLPLLLGAAEFWKARSGAAPRRLALSGLWLGAAAMTRPVAAVFAAAAAAAVVRERRGGWKAALAGFAAGFSAPFLVCAVFFASQGALGDFLAQGLAGNYDWMAHPLAGGLVVILQAAWRAFQAEWPMWLVAAAAVRVLSRRSSPKSGFLLAFAGVSWLALLICRHFYPEEWLLAAPASACLAGAGSVLLRKRLPRPELLILAAQAWFLILNWSGLFGAHPGIVLSWTGQPYEESRLFADYIAATTKPADRVLIVGSEPEILYYAGSSSAVRYLHFFPLLRPYADAEASQRRAWSELERTEPAVVLEVNLLASAPYFLDAQNYFIDRLNEKLDRDYYLDSAASASLSGRATRFFFGPDQVERRLPQERQGITFSLYRRRI